MVNVTMVLPAASPTCVLDAGNTYRVSDGFGAELIKAGAARPAKPTAKVLRVPAKPDPEDDSEDDTDDSEEDDG